MTPLRLADAERIVAACRSRAEAVGVPVTIAVLDHSREALLVLRMDGCPPMPGRVAVAKAFTSASLGLPSDGPLAASQPGGELYGLESIEQLPISTIGGGLPLVADGFIHGAVGVSGGSVAQDTAIARSGLDAWKGAAS